MMYGYKPAQSFTLIPNSPAFLEPSTSDVQVCVRRRDHDWSESHACAAPWPW